MAIQVKDFAVSYKAEAAMSSTDYRFVKIGTGDEEVNLCGAGEKMIGIRQNSPAISEAVNVQIGAVAKLTLGTGGATKGDWLKSDAAGAGVATIVNKDIVGAQALETGNAGEVISVLVSIFTLSTI